MRIVVSDSNCLIDLRKVSLLDTFLRLPYEFLIPNTLFEEELLKFTAAQKEALIHSGLKVMDLPGERVLRAQEVLRKIPQPSVHDSNSRPLECDSSWFAHFDSEIMIRHLPRAEMMAKSGLPEPESAPIRQSGTGLGS